MWGISCTAAVPHVRANIDAGMQPPAIVVAFTGNLISVDLKSRYVADEPGVQSDPRERSIVAWCDNDRVIGDNCIFTAEEDYSHVRGINNCVVCDGLPRAREGNAVRPSKYVAVIICHGTACNVCVFTGGVNGYILNEAARTAKD